MSTGQFEETEKRSPSEVEKSARAIVDKVDVPKLEIAVKVVSWPRGKGSKYSAWHNLPTTDPEKAKKASTCNSSRQDDTTSSMT